MILKKMCDILLMMTSL